MQLLWEHCVFFSGYARSGKVNPIACLPSWFSGLSTFLLCFTSSVISTGTRIFFFLNRSEHQALAAAPPSNTGAGQREQTLGKVFASVLMNLDQCVCVRAQKPTTLPYPIAVALKSPRSRLESGHLQDNAAD